ncbi:MAG: sigma-70 family RNA polymerase sigma factor [Rubrivivax sp.]|nr:MAG: sigma-70 family RNA polymerase sigma factor [Rubrivivax sp.]
MEPNPQPKAAAAQPVRPRPSPLSIVKSDTAHSTLPTPDELAGLVRAVAESADRQAFAVLFKHFAPRVKSYLMRAGADDDQAEDLAQETMVMLWRKAALFDSAQAAASTWIFTIARNLRVDRFRRQGGLAGAPVEGVELDEIADDTPSAADRLHTGRMEETVRAAMRRLPAEQALVLQLSYYEDQPHAQIARELGIPLGTVKSRVRLAVSHMRRLMGGLES